MAKTSSYRTLIWTIVILLATNLSMGITFLYHKQQDKKAAQKTEEAVIDVPTEQRTRFFREQLNLTPEQVDQFRELNRDYNRTAWQIAHQLESLRAEMVEEMSKPEPVQQRLDEITKEIGELHTRLKNVTIGYYTGMKTVCNAEQKEKLNEIFRSMLKQNENVKLPGGYGRKGRGFGNNN
jgi:Spy/CpxP family protein refolding chaperone